MKVQRVQVPGAEHPSWLVLDDHSLPIAPILAFLKFLANLGRSPHTIRTTAYHLKLFWEFLCDEKLAWTDLDVAHFAAFVGWLRLPDPHLIPLPASEARRTDATIDQILTAIHSFYDFQMRLKTVPDIPLYHFLMVPNRRYKSFLHGFVKAKPVQSRIVKVKREQRQVKTLTHEQVAQLIEACARIRDKFLLTLLYETGMRIGHYMTLLANASNTGMIQCKEKVSKESLSKEESHVDVSPSVGNHSRGNSACGPCSLSERDLGDAVARQPGRAVSG